MKPCACLFQFLPQVVVLFFKLGYLVLKFLMNSRDLNDFIIKLTEDRDKRLRHLCLIFYKSNKCVRIFQI